jgi:hypothetical protein
MVILEDHKDLLALKEPQVVKVHRAMLAQVVQVA